MSWIQDNLAEALFLAGLALLIMEVLVLSFSTIILFFLGSALIITGLGVYIGIIGNDILDAILIIGVLTAVLAVALWKPLKRLQEQRDDSPVTSDLVGFTFILKEDVTPSSEVTYPYSGLQWKLLVEETIPAGTKVKVESVEVGAWHIKAFSSSV